MPQNKYMNYLSDDITFCMEDCPDEECYRNKKNIRVPEIPHSFSLLKDTEYCPSYYKEK